MHGTFGQFMFVNAADDLRRLGRWDEAVQRLEQAERLDLGVTASAMLHATAGHLHALRGERDRARSHLARAHGLTGAGLPAEFVTPIRSASAALALVEGDPRAARGHVDFALAAGGERDLLYTPELLSLGARAEADAAERARALRREADRDDAVARAGALIAAFDELLARRPGGEPPPDALAYRALAEAEHSRAVGDARAAGAGHADRWAAAAAAFDALGDPAPAAYARLRHAEVLLTAGGDRRAAAEQLAAAHVAATALGARPLDEDVQALARRARLPVEPATVGEPALRAAPADELPLTSREADVLELLAAGLTNREIATRLFISEKTVGTHVGHIYEKLGVHSRVEAAGRAQALGVGGRRGLRRRPQRVAAGGHLGARSRSLLGPARARPPARRVVRTPASSGLRLNHPEVSMFTLPHAGRSLRAVLVAAVLAALAVSVAPQPFADGSDQGARSVKQTHV